MPIIELKDLKTHLPPRSRLLGMDHAEKTLGLAFSNPELTLCTPFKTLTGKNFTENIRTLAGICQEYNASVFIIGLPLNMDGTEGPRCQSVRDFAANLIRAKKQLGFEPVIAFVDERLSTFAADDLLAEDLGMPRDKRKLVIDAHAAAHILQAAIDKANG